jgi:hypothetical protein
VKMKCHLDEGGERCARCDRKSLDCVFKQHRRGRRLGMRSANASKNSEDACPPRPQRRTAVTSTDEITLSPVDGSFWPDTRRGLHPASLMSRQTREGGFSLQNVLRPDLESRLGPTTTSSDPDGHDPVAAGLLNQAIASSLFTGYDNRRLKASALMYTTDL